MFDRLVSFLKRAVACPPLTTRAWIAIATFVAASAVGITLAQDAAVSQDSSPHRRQFVQVDQDVELEVLDWGGSGPPLVLLSGLGGTAHDFDQFAPKLIHENRVFGITRRGFGASSRPPTANHRYSATRLGDDVLAVCEALRLNRPVLVGHSIAGEELSSVATRHPEKISAAIYLDAAYAYAYYEPSIGDPWIDSLEVRRKLEQLIPGRGPKSLKQATDDLLMSLPAFEATLRAWRKYLDAMPPLPTYVEPELTPAQAILEGQEKFGAIRIPALAIYAIPKNLGRVFANNPVAQSNADAAQLAFDGALAKAFQAAVPSARVVVLPRANHYVYRSNEADVLREMHAFLARLDGLAR